MSKITKRTWAIAGKSASHTVCLEHSYQGAARLAVNESIVFCRPRKRLEPGFSHKFSVDGVDCLVRVDLTRSLSFTYQLLLNGANAALVDFKCPYCRNHVSFQDTNVGMAQECPTCHNNLVVEKQGEKMDLTLQPVDQKRVAQFRQNMMFIRSLRLLCLVVAIWIGCANNWAGLAWIPIGILLILAYVGNLVGYICAFLIHLRVVYCMYRIAHDFSHMSPGIRERFLNKMDPDFREKFLKWLNKP